MKKVLRTVLTGVLSLAITPIVEGGMMLSHTWHFATSGSVVNRPTVLNLCGIRRGQIDTLLNREKDFAAGNTRRNSILWLGSDSTRSTDEPIHVCDIKHGLIMPSTNKSRDCVVRLSGSNRSHNNIDGRCFLSYRVLCNSMRKKNPVSSWRLGSNLTQWWNIAANTSPTHNPVRSSLFHHEYLLHFASRGGIDQHLNSTPYGSLVRFRDSFNRLVPTSGSSETPNPLAYAFTNFLLWGHFAISPKCAIRHIDSDIYFNMHRSLVHMSDTKYVPTMGNYAALQKMLYDSPNERTLSTPQGWGKKLIIGKSSDGTNSTAIRSKYKSYLTTTIDFAGNADWCTPFKADKKRPRRCREKPAVDVIDLLNYKADVAANSFPPIDVGKAENLWWFRAYAALGVANYKPLRKELIQWFKGDKKYDPTTLKSKLLGCPVCLDNTDNQNHYLINNVRRLLWDGEEKHDIDVDKTDMVQFYRYLAMTDRLVATLISVGADITGKAFVSGKLQNIKEMDEIPLEYKCDTTDCSGLAIDVAYSLYKLSIYLKTLPKLPTTGIGPVIHSNPALVPSMPNHYADWKDAVECGGKPADDCTQQPYAQFQAKVKHRPSMVYVGANDGHLYAFKTDDPKTSLRDKTVFMYVPEAILPYVVWLALPFTHKLVAITKIRLKLFIT